MDVREPPSLSSPPEATGRRGSGFLRSVLVLVSGTALAHGITAAAMPLLSRIYTPAEFGLLAVFASCLAIISVIACLRLELAIPLPESPREAMDLLLLSLLSCLCISLLVSAPALLVPQLVANWLGQPELASYLWLLPLGVLWAGSYSALQFWHVREKHFGWLAKTRVAQSAGSAATQLGLGIGGVSPLGLLLGHVMNTGIACVALGSALRQAAPWPTRDQLLALLSKYLRFPTLSAPEALANSLALQLPVILIAAIVAPAEAGYLSMAMFVIQAPMSLIGTAISQVYLSRAPQALRDRRLGEFTADVLAGLWKAGAGPLLALGLLAPLLFEPVFGDGWARAGWLVSWMTPWFITQFLAAPLSMVLHICGRQREALTLQVFGLLLRVGMVLAAAHWLPNRVAEAYAISGAVFYIAYLILVLRVAGVSYQQLLQGFKAGSRVTLAWCSLAVLGQVTLVTWRSI